MRTFRCDRCNAEVEWYNTTHVALTGGTLESNRDLCEKCAAEVAEHLGEIVSRVVDVKDRVPA